MDINSLLDFSQYLTTDVHSVFSFNPDGKTRFSIACDAGFSPNSLAVPKQVHSTEVKWVDTPGEYSGIDGLITSSTDLILTLKVADCVPVYFFEQTQHMIGLVHSGWRGTVGGIIINIVKLMQKHGAAIGEILVYMGPAIGGCCYEVDAEVADSFDNESKLKVNNRKWKIDLHKQIRLQLIEAGISVGNIQASDICTYESKACHSYRRDSYEAGRMYAFMSVK